KGADPLRCNASGQTPLMSACTRNGVSSARLLAERGGMTARRDQYGDTHLMHISAYPHFNYKDGYEILSILKNILTALPDEVNAIRTEDGKTALHIAIEATSANTALIECLLAAPGIDINIADKKG